LQLFLHDYNAREGRFKCDWQVLTCTAPVSTAKPGIYLQLTFTQKNTSCCYIFFVRITCCPP